MQVNSLAWWEREFEHNWVHSGINGIKQTRYFMQLIIKNLPIKPLGTILDYGCALGQGVHELAVAYPNCRVEGYDYANTAIRQAREIYPQYVFHENVPSETYDTVISSNVLEHYTEPVAQLRGQIAKAGRYYVALTPYNEDINNTHPVSINTETYPVTLDEFGRKHTIIIVPENHALCYIAQLLVVYEREVR